MLPLRDDRSTYIPPIVTTLLIVACAFVFLYEVLLDDFSRNYFVARYAMVPAHFRPVTLITSAFLHGGWMHIILNMIFLWVFGRSLEDAMGHAKFLGFYLLCAVISGIVQFHFMQYSNVPTVGASGAIAGVMGAYLIKFPRSYIHTLVFIVIFVTIVEIPAAFILIYWFALQLFSGYGAITTTQVASADTAWFAHIGGFIAGMLLVTLMGTRNRYYRHVEGRW